MDQITCKISNIYILIQFSFGHVRTVYSVEFICAYEKIEIQGNIECCSLVALNFLSICKSNTKFVVCVCTKPDNHSTFDSISIHEWGVRAIKYQCVQHTQLISINLCGTNCHRNSNIWRTIVLTFKKIKCCISIADMIHGICTYILCMYFAFHSDRWKIYLSYPTLWKWTFLLML